jgi:acetyltransferase-like isoleucine patch superfamily enzyme
MKIIARRILSIVFRALNQIILKVNRVQYGKNLKINGLIYINNCGQIIIGDNVVINSGHRFSPVGGQTRTRLITGPEGRIVISSHVGISNSTLVSQASIHIGEKSLVGGSCNIWDTDFHSLDSNLRGGPKDSPKIAPIHVGARAFIGAHSILLKGTTIADHEILGAGSVVRRCSAQPTQRATMPDEP